MSHFLAESSVTVNDLERIFSILLILQSRPTVTAQQLAERLEVSRRTIARDLQRMSLLGIPIYGERGRNGGIRLLEGYFLPPLTFTQEEAVALTLALHLLRSLRVAPFQDEVESVAQKVLAAVPEPLRGTLTRLDRILGVESPPVDIFHAELSVSSPAEPAYDERATVTEFLRALLAQRRLRLRYRSPYRASAQEDETTPLGIFWDRGHWYLAGTRAGSVDGERLWRADRVLGITPLHTIPPDERVELDIATLMGHAWLRPAMAMWRTNAPVRLRLTADQAARLRQDWYYRLAAFEPQPDGTVEMTLGEQDPDLVTALARWLGPGAELLAPNEWRALLRAQLIEMLAALKDT